MNILSNLPLFQRDKKSAEAPNAPSAVQRAFKDSSAIPGLFQGLYNQGHGQAGVLVTDELQKAIDECTAQVDRTSKWCRARNRKFRDTEFDLESERDLCLHGLSTDKSECYSPADVRRVSDIFNEPKFNIDGVGTGDVVQGNLGDCWFLSGLAIMSTSPRLFEKCCVKRDEKVGVYGFVFFRNKNWVSVIVDDLLYTKIRKYEDLSYDEQQLYHKDKNQYNDIARKGSKTLYFASSDTQGETWVPLIEKAYAKLYGNYAYLEGGQAGEAIEDMTGGVNTFIFTKDILDVDEFWTNELMDVSKDRLFGCSFSGADKEGLFGDHAYSVLRAVEFRGKRFLVIRNPWGRSEWTGRWSDGAKEWTRDGGWLDALPVLKHGFGDDGEFVMEYCDFLETWEQLDRVLIFDSSWVLSNYWLNVKGRTIPSAWSYGDVSYTFKLPGPTKAVIALSQVDKRYFRELTGRSTWYYEFALFKNGFPEPIATSDNSANFDARSVNIEVQLEEGEYVVHVRLDREFSDEEDWYEDGLETWNKRKLARILMQRAQSVSLAQNFEPAIEAVHMPLPLRIVAGQDIATLEKKAKDVAEAKLKEFEEEEEVEEEKQAGASSTTTTTTTTASRSTMTTTTTTIVSSGSKSAEGLKDKEGDREGEEKKEGEVKQGEANGVEAMKGEAEEGSGKEGESKGAEGKEGGKPEEKVGAARPPPPQPPAEPQDLPPFVISDDHVVLGLSVYTHKDVPVTITGQVHSDSKLIPGLAGLALAGDP